MVKALFPYIGAQAVKLHGGLQSFIASRRARAAVNNYKRDPKLGIGVIDFSEIEKQTYATKDVADVDYADTLRSPRALLETLIPPRCGQVERMNRVLASNHITDVEKLKALKSLAWNGTSNESRPKVWRMLLKYEPLIQEERSKVLLTKRKVYQDLVRLSTTQVERERKRRQQRALKDGETLHVPRSHACGMVRQIELDLPRTHPEKAFFQIDLVRDVLRQCLLVFAVTKIDIGYVQGMNEIMALILIVVVSECFPNGEKSIDNIAKLETLPDQLDRECLDCVEADVFWCFVALTDQVYDNYTIHQPGIHLRIEKMEDVVRFVDPELTNHFDEIGLEFMQFAFRWMNCLWVREFPFGVAAQMWDAFLAEQDGFSEFQVFFSAALIVRCREELLNTDFQDAIMFLQHLPAKLLTPEEVGVMLSQAFLWRKEIGDRFGKRKGKSRWMKGL